MDEDKVFSDWESLGIATTALEKLIAMPGNQYAASPELRDILEDYFALAKKALGEGPLQNLRQID